MALLSVSTQTARSSPLLFLSFCALSGSSTSSFSLSLSIPSQRPFQPLSSSSSSTALRRLPRCGAAPQDPPPGNDSAHPKDIAASLSKVQDRVQIFLAVLFWMSLFFWASAWDGRNRPNKGSRFRR